MTYAVNGLIQATDYNGFIATINGAWAAGTADAGYGQAAFSTVTAGDPVRARPATQSQAGGAGTTPTWSGTPEWRALIDTVNAMSNHQTGAAAVAAGDFTAAGGFPTAATATSGIIAYGTTVSAAITTVSGTQRLSATAQGAAVTSSATIGTNWSTSGSGTGTLTVGTDARYWFNCGGTLKIAFSNPGTTNPIDSAWNTFCTNIGTLTYTSKDTSKTIAGTTYAAGFNRSGTAGTVTATNGFNDGGTATWSGTLGSGAFTNIGITVNVTIAANVINVAFTITSPYPNTVAGGAGVGLTVTVTANPPDTTYIFNTWGTTATAATITGSAAAACTTPTIGTTLSPTTATVSTAYSATIVVNNCTTATVTNLPAWASQSYAQSGLNGTITITGTPAAGDVTAGLALLVNATNNPGGCTSSSATGLAGGTLIVNNGCATPASGAITL